MVAGVPAAAIQLRFARFWRAAGVGRALSGGAQEAGAWLDRTVASRERARIPLHGSPVFCCAALSPLSECPFATAQHRLAAVAARTRLQSMLRQGSQQYCRLRADSVAAHTKARRQGLQQHREGRRPARRATVRRGGAGADPRAHAGDASGTREAAEAENHQPDRPRGRAYRGRIRSASQSRRRRRHGRRTGAGGQRRHGATAGGGRRRLRGRGAVGRAQAPAEHAPSSDRGRCASARAGGRRAGGSHGSRRPRPRRLCLSHRALHLVEHAPARGRCRGVRTAAGVWRDGREPDHAGSARNGAVAGRPPAHRRGGTGGQRAPPALLQAQCRDGLRQRRARHDAQRFFGRLPQRGPRGRDPRRRYRGAGRRPPRGAAARPPSTRKRLIRIFPRFPTVSRVFPEWSGSGAVLVAVCAGKTGSKKPVPGKSRAKRSLRVLIMKTDGIDQPKGFVDGNWSAAARAGRGRTSPWVAIAVVVLLAVLGWFGWKHWSSPKPQTKGPAATAVTTARVMQGDVPLEVTANGTVTA
uniref:Uncharacterized protein n=1 Tax=Solanum lycopersicum TaxID=4081 RepID=A0A494G9V1_SOLLC